MVVSFELTWKDEQELLTEACKDDVLWETFRSAVYEKGETSREYTMDLFYNDSQ